MVELRVLGRWLSQYHCQYDVYEVAETNMVVLTHFSQETPELTNSADADQMLQNTASDQGLHCLH